MFNNHLQLVKARALKIHPIIMLMNKFLLMLIFSSSFVEEEVVTFRPTYRYKVGSHNMYIWTKRKPGTVSYCLFIPYGKCSSF